MVENQEGKLKKELTWLWESEECDHPETVKNIVSELLAEAKADLLKNLIPAKMAEEKHGDIPGELQFQEYSFWFMKWFGEVK